MTNLRTTLSPAVLLVAVAFACGCGGGAGAPADAGSDGTLDAADASADTSMDAQIGCPRAAAPADRARKVVISRPFGAGTSKATTYEVLDLAADGTLTRPATPVTFSMGTGLEGSIVFTPDGKVGLAAQDDGSVGVFTLDSAGTPTVVQAAFRDGFYAQRVVVSSDGARAWVLDPDTGNNGGGVYELAIGCDGTLTSRGLVVSGGGANAMTLLPTDPTKGVLAATAAYDSGPGLDLHVVDLFARTRVASVAAFPDGGAIPSDVAVTPDGKYALVADDGVLVGNRVAVVGLDPTPAQAGLLSTPYPAALVMSPWGNAAVVLNDDATNQIHVLAPTTNGTSWTITGELAYVYGAPQLPVSASLIARGALEGYVFVAENQAVRTLAFTAAGQVIDTAKLTFSGGNESIVGIVGVQP
jgi:DNA-binding beta-propeller fold protein YncE